MSDRPEWKSDKGATLYACVGGYAGFRIKCSRGEYGFVLGWISIMLVLRDVERVVGNHLSFANWIVSHDLHLPVMCECETCCGTWVMRYTKDGMPEYCPHCGGRCDTKEGAGNE